MSPKSAESIKGKPPTLTLMKKYKCYGVMRCNRFPGRPSTKIEHLHSIIIETQDDTMGTRVEAF